MIHPDGKERLPVRSDKPPVPGAFPNSEEIRLGIHSYSPLDIWYVFLALLIAAIFVGVVTSISGIVLSYLAAAILVFALTRTWQGVKRFLILLGASVVGFFVFLLLHRGLDKIAIGTTASGWLVEGLQMVLFYLIAFVCPVCWVVGVAGSLMMFLRRRRRVG